MGEYGFTIIEVLLTMVILSLGIMGILEGYGTSSEVLRIAEETLKVVQFLEVRMAEVKMMVIKEEIELGETKGEIKWWNKRYLWNTRIFESSTYKGVNEVEIIISREGEPSSRRYVLRTFLLPEK